MGGSSSKPTRKLTIENDDPTSVIKVSDEVVERLKGNHGGKLMFFIKKNVLIMIQI